MQSGDVTAVEQMLRELGEREGGEGEREVDQRNQQSAPCLHRQEPVSNRAYNTDLVYSVHYSSLLPLLSLLSPWLVCCIMTFG